MRCWLKLFVWTCRLFQWWRIEASGHSETLLTLDIRFHRIPQVIIPRLYNKEEEFLKKELENIEHIAPTTGEKTSRATAATVHFIDNNMTLQSGVLETGGNKICDIGKYKG